MRRLYDIRELAGMPSDKKTMVCPLPMHAHQNYTPSFSVFTRPDGVQYFRCHGSCGRDGDAVDFAGFMFISNYDPHDSEMVKRAITLLQAGFQVSPPRQQARRIQRLPADAMHKLPKPDLDVYAYAYSERGLEPETLDRFGVRMYESMGAKYMAIPTYHFGQLISVKLRNINARHHRDRFMFYPGSKAGLFNYAGVFGTSEPLLIVKAEIPAMLLLQHGIHTCAPSGSENVNQGELFQAMAWAVKRVVVKDNDPDPKVRAEMDRYAQARAEAFKAKLKAPHERYKDVDQWVLADTKNALATIREWLK